jgi:hypothetical protein
MTRDEIERAIKPLVGLRIVRLCRIARDYRGRVETETGVPEIWFDDDTVLRVTGESDGERFKLLFGAWTDPDPPPWSEQQLDFFAACGRALRVDLSAEPEYSDLIGARVLGFELLADPFGAVGGLGIHTETRSFWYANIVDDDHLLMETPPGFHVVSRTVL